MSIIIRLQNLPLEANSLDIRRFFQGLHIPDGGVHIVGGENGDAFIAFGSDEDARQAMGRDGNLIKSSRVKLLLSSRNEMQRVIDNVRVAMAMSINNPAALAATGGAPSGGGSVVGGGIAGVGGGGGGIAGINQAKKDVIQGGGGGNSMYVGQQQQQPPMAQVPKQPLPPNQASGPVYRNVGGPQQQPPTGGGYQGSGPAGQVTHPQFSGPMNQNQNNLGYGGGMQQQPPPKMMHSNEAPNFQQQRQQPNYRARSRSRSPPPTRVPSQLLPDVISSDGGGGQHSMQSGLMGSLQQQQPQPPPNQMYGQNNGYNQQQQLPPNNGGGPQQSNSYDNGTGGPGGNYYARPPPPPQQQPQYGGEDRWTSGNNQGPMMGAGSLGQSGMGQIDSYQQQPNQNMYPRGGDPRGVGIDPRNVVNQPPYNQQQQQYPQQTSSGPMGYNSGNLSNMAGAQRPMSNSNTRLFDVQLWNLPEEIRTYDLLNFFAPLYLAEEHVKIFYDGNGRPSGMAVVSFGSARDMDVALGYNGRPLLGRNVTIRPMTDLAPGGVSGNSGNLGSGISGAGGPGGNVNNGGYGGQHVNNNSNFMPPNSTSQMPSNEPPPPSAFDQNYPQGGGGVGFRASPPMDLPYTNTRPPPPGGPFQGGPPQSHPPPPQSQRYLPPQMPGGPRPPKQLVLFMKGLPFSSCTPRDVEEFFQPIPLANIEIERDGRGKPSGNAFVEFDNKLDYDRAKSDYNMRHMGHRYIELIPLHKLMMGPKGAAGGDHRGGPHHRPQTFCISVKGLSPSVSSQDLKNYFGVNGARPFAVHIMLTPNQLNAGEAFLEFTDKEGYKRALSRDGAELGRDRLMIQHVPYEMVMAAINGGGGGPKGGGGGGFAGGPGGFKGPGKPHVHGHGAPMPPPPPPPPRAPAPFEDRAATLIAFDCSSKAVEEDYCSFFEKFAIVPDRVKMTMNSHTGAIETHISFHSREDAKEAMRTANGKFFFGRTMKLEYL